MRIHASFTILYTLINVNSALYTGKWCPVACDTTLNYATFNDTDAWLSNKVQACRSKLRVTSLYLCFENYCEDDGARIGWIEEQSGWCDEHAGVTLPSYQHVVDPWKPSVGTNVTALSADEALKSPVLGEVVLPDASFVHRAFTTMVWTLVMLYSVDYA